MSADLVAANDELLSVLEQLPEGVFVLDAASVVLFANKPGLRLVKMKPKHSLGTVFAYPLEDGPMRDFDVEMLVKSINWGGQEAQLVHLKPLKSAGAFHLEWKLESALEKARSAEQMLEEWKSRQELPSESSPNPELERSLVELGEQLAAAQTRENELSGKLDEYLTLIEKQRQEFEERQSELESLLELAETRADDLQNEVVSGDHQTASELQRAMTLAQEAEEQMRNLEKELTEAQNRLRVAEEQAEVAEERAYGLESELDTLSSKVEQQSSQEEVEALRDEIAELAQRLNQSEEEVAILSDRVEAKEQELAELSSLGHTQNSSHEQELLALGEQLQSKEIELSELAEQMHHLESEVSSLGEQLQSKTTEAELLAGSAEKLLELNAELVVRDEEIASLRLELASQAELLGDSQELQAKLESLELENSEKTESFETVTLELEQLKAKLEEAEETLRVRSEESDELAEQLRAETEQSEELVEQLRQDNDRLHESLREQSEELEGLRDIATDAETMVEEFQELQNSHAELVAKLSALEGSTDTVEQLQKEVQKLNAQLEEAAELIEKGERVDKLERKLEGALRRSEEAEERLEEERRLLAELRQTSERRIAELESQSRAGHGGEVDAETERMAFQDSLTGLPNRNILYKYLGFMLQQAVRYERYTALLRIDCDKFKTISDTFGSEVGDRLIRLIGERLSAVVRASDVLGRLADDEFVILLSDLRDEQEASVITASVIKRIYLMLKKPFSVDDQSISVGVSMGVSLYPLDAANGEQMFQHSAVALKRAKDTGRGQAQYFTPEVQSTHEARVMLDHELKLGLERNEFGLLYQPIFDLSNGQIVGVEALIRWNHPRLGAIGPDEFLKVAEESGLIVLIGNWALRSALQRAAQWQAGGLGLFVSLNLSRRQLLQADLLPTIHAALSEFRCSPDRILLEISEELTGPELPRLRDTLLGLQQLGVRLAVDNFGTSASSLQELRRGPFQVLKIDRRFVRGVPNQEENAGIVLSALTLGHHLGRITVAVGVETEAEKNWLAKTGCRFAQGNLLAGPLPPEHVPEIVARR